MFMILIPLAMIYYPNRPRPQNATSGGLVTMPTSISTTTTPSQCGGLAGIPCPEGYYCKLPENCFDCFGECMPK